VEGQQDGAASIQRRAKAELPAQALEHDQLPRLWAGARVQALLDQIERDGETEAAVNEIIRLARRYKFVTPYTSFLAAPRALLRPRVIRPGDPVLRVHTDKAIVSVIALFPFGLEKPLRYLAGEDVWQTRFLAPTDMKDGSYPVRLVLRDTNGQVYRESKSFVIASTPPAVKVRLERNALSGGRDDSAQGKCVGEYADADGARGRTGASKSSLGSRARGKHGADRAAAGAASGRVCAGGYGRRYGAQPGQRGGAD
jgi:hypothetical protein